MRDQSRGILTIISGFSGAGKGTVVKKLLTQFPDRFRLSVSATTREPRDGEQDGIDYFFKTREQFEQMIREHALLEYAVYVDNYYGTPRDYVKEQLALGYDVILEIEQQGAFQVKQAMPEALLIFLTPPTIEELERRLRARNTESEAVILSRLSQAAIEAEHIDLYDYIVFNDDLQACADSLVHLIESERQKIRYNETSIQELQRDLQLYRKGE